MQLQTINNDPHRTVLIFKPQPEDIPNIDFAKPIKEGILAAKFNATNHLRLTAMGYAPPDLMEGYHWPGKFRPFENQKITAQFMLSHYRCWVLNEMRSGKTSSAGWAIHRGMQLGDIKKVLILAPLSILKTAWYREMYWIHAGKTPIFVEDGPVPRLRETIKQAKHYGKSILITNHDKVKFAEKELIEFDADCIVVDEASAFRNAETDKFKALKSVAKPGVKLWLLTAGPCPNAPTDVWGLSKLINPAKTPKYFGRWRDMTMNPIKMGHIVKWTPKKDSEKTVADLLQPSIKFATSDCIDLPPQVYMKRKVKNSTEQTRLLNEIKKKHVGVTKEGEVISAANAAVALSKYLQISCGVVYDSAGVPQVIDGANNRLKELVEIYRESGNKKLLVFGSFKIMQAYIKSYLNKQGIRTEIINGDTPAAQRATLIDKFQQPDMGTFEQDPESIRVLILHPKVGKFGLTLSVANTTVWYGPTYSAEDYIQSNARAQGARTATKQKTSIIMLEGSDVEGRIYDRLRDMEARQNSVTEIYRYIFGGS